MENANLKWRKSSHSGNGGGNCVEVGSDAHGLVIRDTQDQTGPVLKFSAEAWRKLIANVTTERLG
jgi:hypothetical protein